MSSVNGPGVVIFDKDGGDAVTVTDSRLDVNVAGMTVGNVTVDSEFPAAAALADNSSNSTSESFGLSLNILCTGPA